MGTKIVLLLYFGKLYIMIVTNVCINMHELLHLNINSLSFLSPFQMMFSSILDPDLPNTPVAAAVRL